MKINEFDNEVTQKELDMLETYIDKAFNKIGIDVEFTRHFLDRVNDERNIRQITIKELGMLFAKEYKRWGKPIAQLGPDAEAVMKDISSDINIPFALKWDRNNNQLELVAKTVMRKKNFKTPNKEFPVESIEEHDDPSSYVKTIRIAGYSIYVSKIAGGEGGQRFEIETPSGKEFEVIERKVGHYELFKNGPTMSGKGEVFGSLMDAIRAAETANEAAPSQQSVNENQSSLEGKIDDAYEYFDKNPAKDSLDAILIFEKNDTFQSVHNRNSYRHTLADEGWQLVCIVNSDRRLQLAKKYEYIRTNENINEDFGSIPALTDLIVMAVVGQTTVAALKAAYKTGKYALKLKKLADKAGVKLNNAVMGESNPFTDARMNAIKAGKKEFTVNDKKYRVTGDTSDEREAIANEAINKDEYTAQLAANAQDKFMTAALGALDRLVKSDPRGQSIGGYAFDIARAFSGINARELESVYAETHRKK